MKVTFILTTNLNKPIGGHKIVYEYANYMANKGIKVRLIFVKHPDFYNKTLLYRCTQYLYWTLFKKTPYKNYITWYPLDKRIEIDWNINPRHVKVNSDELVVATASWTAVILNKVQNIPNIQKFYFIQSYEALWSSEEMVDATWQMPFIRIVIATWLQELGENKFNVATNLIPNFLTEGSFLNSLPQKQRNKTISLLIHSSKLKKSDVGIRILKLVHRMDPDVNFLLFGTVSKFQTDLPNSKYYENASEETLNEIYNESMIYLVPSQLEGWGLTAMEAISSGAVVVSNKNGGVNDFIKSEYSGWIMSFDNEQEVANLIVNLINNAQLREKIVTNSEIMLRQFSLEKSADEFINLLKKSDSNTI